MASLAKTSTAFVVLLLVLASCGGSAGKGGGGSAPTTYAPPTTQSPITAETTEPDTEMPTVESPSTAPRPDVVSWEDVLGKSFEDPEVQSLAKSCGAGTENNSEIGGSPSLGRAGNVVCKSGGFELNLDSNLAVKSVSLYNEEQDGFSQYQGSLPYELTWDMTYEEIIEKLGQPDQQWGGNGLEVRLIYEHLAPYKLDIYLTATHNNPEDLAGSQMHFMEVSQS